ncbi:hypothetical protein LINPERPRIM_LOCUS35208 [Linum perenne]
MTAARVGSGSRRRRDLLGWSKARRWLSWSDAMAAGMETGSGRAGVGWLRLGNAVVAAG